MNKTKLPAILLGMAAISLGTAGCSSEDSGSSAPAKATAPAVATAPATPAEPTAPSAPAMPAAPASPAEVAKPVASAAPAMNGAELYEKKTCVACHGPDAKSPIMPNYPKLAGQNEQYAIAQMKDIKSGARSNAQTAAMKGVMHLVSDEEIAAIGKWLSGLE